MALITEDGTGKTDAESLCTVAFATTYHAARANAAWAALADDATREAYLRRATDYMAIYRERWAGYRKTTTQALDWPRYEVPMKDAVSGTITVTYYPDDEVPAIVAKACAELALRAIDGELLADQETPVIAEKVGPIEVQYAEGARQAVRYPAIDALLAPLFAASGGMLRVVRA